MASQLLKSGSIPILLSILFTLVVLSVQLHAQSTSEYVDTRKKVALIISVGSYSHAPKLVNPLNDGTAIAEHLRSIGFQVRYTSDATEAEARLAIENFKKDAEKSDVALFYYSGHGLQIDGENYIVPKDFDVDSRTPLTGLISVSRLMKEVDGLAKAKIFLLDACRDNPFVQKLAEALPQRSIGRGLAPINIDRTSDIPSTQAYGLIVGYATQANDTASDGVHSNSPYARAILHAIASPDEDFGSIMIRVAGLVISETEGVQKPEFRVALSKPLYLVMRPRPLDCDVLAGERDNNVSVPGVEYDLIDVTQAIAACSKDLSRFPDNPRLMHNLARAYDKGGMKQEALALYKKAAELGFAWSQNNLSVMYMSADGIAPDFGQAMFWMRKAYAQGNRQAAINYADTDMSEIFSVSKERTVELQRALKRLGYFSREESGVLDDATKQALSAFKGSRDIRGHGITFQIMDELAITQTVLHRKEK